MWTAGREAWRREEAYPGILPLFMGLRGQALAWACTTDEKTGLLGLPLSLHPWLGLGRIVQHGAWEVTPSGRGEAGEAAISAGGREAHGSSGSSDPQKWPVHIGLFSKYKSAVLGNAGSG